MGYTAATIAERGQHKAAQMARRITRGGGPWAPSGSRRRRGRFEHPSHRSLRSPRRRHAKEGRQRDLAPAPVSDRASEGPADFVCEQRRQRRRCGLAGWDTVGCVKAIPEAHQSFLTVDVEDLCRESLPPVLKPHVVQRAHRVITTGVVGLQLYERAVALGAHPSGKRSTARTHRGKRLERRKTRRQLGCDEGVHGQVDEDLAQPERREPQISEHLKCVAELVNRDEVKEGPQVNATGTVRVGREQRRVFATLLATSCIRGATRRGGPAPSRPRSHRFRRASPRCRGGSDRRRC